MGEFTQHMVVWAHRYQLRRAERLQKYYDLSATKFLKWRTLRRRKALIVVYYLTIAVMLACCVAQLWWQNWLFVWTLCTPVTMMALQVLRFSIRLKDSAPDDFLDEYEYAVITTWRSISLKLIGYLMLPIVYALAFIPLFIPEITVQMAFTIALLLTLIIIITMTLPTVAYAITFTEGAESESDSGNGGYQ